MNYDWYPAKIWGDDAASRYWSEMFNIYPDVRSPDAQADEMLTLMITSQDFPDAIWMDRNDWNRRLARDGYLVDLNTLKPQVDNNWYDDNILQQTQGHLMIDGVLYGIPNWARKDASGGNNCWMYTQSIYEAVGSPKIEVWDDLYNYAISVRDNVTESYGQPVLPFISEAGSIPGENFVYGIYRSFGGPMWDGWWGAQDGTIKPLMFDPAYQAALLEANKWFREGLVDHSMLTNSREQFLEQLSSARAGLIYYDHSQDDSNSFRRNVRGAFPGDSIEVISFQGDGMTRLYPPANGLAPGRIYAEHYNTVGWNVTCIFTNAEQPVRIFELITYLLTKQGSIEMMYGPAGAGFWNELDGNGNPILIANPDDNNELSEQVGTWKWDIAGHADNVDHTKFAVNASQPEDQRSWVISHQSDIFTPLMRPLTDEYNNLGASIEPDTPLANARHACWEYLAEMIPQVIQAPSEDAAKAVIDDILDFFNANNIQDIMDIYAGVYAANLATQGGTIFTR